MTVHLPAQHSDEDLALAGALATYFDSAELYVAWSGGAGASRPVIPAAVHPCSADAPRRRLGSLLGLLRRRRAARG